MTVPTALHALVLAGGGARRLAGASKADVEIGSLRLLDRVLTAVDALRAHAVLAGRDVVVAPSSVHVPAGTLQTMENPPGTGPLAGIGAGMGLLADAGPDDLVLVAAVDSPGIGAWAPQLLQAMCSPAAARFDGVVVSGGGEPRTQPLQAVYRHDRLARALKDAGPLENRPARRLLGHMDLAAVPVPDDLSRDVDTADDLAWWRARPLP